MRTTTTLLLACLALTACSHRIEADPTFLVLDQGDTWYEINVTSGRPHDLRADNWHRSIVAKPEFDTEAQKGDHVVCHLTETDTVRITNCRKTSGP